MFCIYVLAEGLRCLMFYDPMALLDDSKLGCMIDDLIHSFLGIDIFEKADISQAMNIHTQRRLTYCHP